MSCTFESKRADVFRNFTWTACVALPLPDSENCAALQLRLRLYEQMPVWLLCSDDLCHRTDLSNSCSAGFQRKVSLESAAANDSPQRRI